MYLISTSGSPAGPSRTWIATLMLIAAMATGVGTTGADDDLAPQDSTAAAIEFNRDIRGILAEHCFACHGPDAASRAADLRLDDSQAAIDHGALVPGDAQASEIVRRISSTDPDQVMPPPESGEPLAAREQALIRSWIDQGGHYQTHWAFTAVTDPPLPSLPATMETWPIEDLDHFVAARLHAAGGRGAKAADDATWLRRVCLDLTGLPPTPQQIAAFQSDPSDDRHAAAVDALLASDAFGQRMASMWLDVVRYADTFGYQADVEMHVWPYRDWVIKAFNDNLPYDQFLTWQIAGDRLPDATDDQRLATTMNRLHRATNEGGSIAEEFRIAGVADRTTTAATAFLGLTMECARCHDHKYDPITQHDFYALSAYFADIDEAGLYSHFTVTSPPPTMLLYRGDQRDRHLAARRAVRDALGRWEAITAAAERRAAASPEPKTPRPLPPSPQPDWHFDLEGDQVGVRGNATRCTGDDAIPCEGVPNTGRHDPLSLSLWLRPSHHDPRMVIVHQSVAAEDSAFRGWQLVLDEGRPQFSLIHFWPGNALRVETLASIPRDRWTHVAVTYDGTSRAAGVRLFIDGRPADVKVLRDQLTREILHLQQWGDLSVDSVRVTLAARFRDTGFRDGMIDDLSIFARQLSDPEVAAIYAAAAPPPANDVTPTARQWAMHDALHHDTESIAARDDVLAAMRRENEIVNSIHQIMVMEKSRHDRPVHLLARGDYASPTEVVTPATPQFLGPTPHDQPDRLALARWMTDPANPLTSRVAVNRFWHLFFGRGLVASLDDFGSQGSPPADRDLLDHLATGFVRDGWDVKTLCRRITLSATYRQSSSPADTAVIESDPELAHLAHGPRHRLSAEQIRDVALAASGLLVDTIGGPSVKPYQPEGLWEEAGTGKHYDQATDDGLYRRSLYTFWRRTSPPPSMLTFDATSREVCTAKRELTTTPLQSLVLLNDPQYVEAARVLSQNLIISHGDDLNARWDEACLRLFARTPSVDQREIIAALYQQQLESFTRSPDDAAAYCRVGASAVPAVLRDDPAATIDLAATAVVVGMLISYDETMMKR